MYDVGVVVEPGCGCMMWVLWSQGVDVWCGCYGVRVWVYDVGVVVEPGCECMMWVLF